MIERRRSEEELPEETVPTFREFVPRTNGQAERFPMGWMVWRTRP
jgi:hypothetical protein